MAQHGVDILLLRVNWSYRWIVCSLSCLNHENNQREYIEKGISVKWLNSWWSIKGWKGMVTLCIKWEIDKRWF